MKEFIYLIMNGGCGYMVNYFNDNFNCKIECIELCIGVVFCVLFLVVCCKINVGEEIIYKYNNIDLKYFFFCV